MNAGEYGRRASREVVYMLRSRPTRTHVHIRSLLTIILYNGSFSRKGLLESRDLSSNIHVMVGHVTGHYT